MLDVKKLLSKILNSPFIVEEGTSGIWTYRKWSDGIAECWGTATNNSIAFSSAIITSLYKSGDINVNLPFTFTSIGAVNINANAVAGDYGWIGRTSYNLTSGIVLYQAFKRSSTTGSVVVYIDVKGTWK